MIPAAFDYQAPATLEEAVSLIANDPDGAKVLAGGHSLIPAMKLRLAQPQLLVDIARIPSLSYIREEGNQTLIGGSLAHSDPAGDWPAAVLALDADLVLVGPNGERTIKAADFFVDLLTTDLQPGEILREIRIAKPSGRFGQAYQKAPHPASGFAVVGIAVNLALNDNGSCKAASIGVTGVGVKAYRAHGVEAALAGKNLDEQVVADAAAHVCDGVDPNADLYASGEYRCHLAKVHTRRALQAAKANVK